MKLYDFCLIALLIIAVVPKGYWLVKKAKGVLVLSWPGYECEKLKKENKYKIDIQCDQQKLELWDHQSFVIREFSFDKRPSQCQQSSLNTKIIKDNQNLNEKLRKYASSFSAVANSTENLWSSIWSKSNYAEIFIKNPRYNNMLKKIDWSRLIEQRQAQYFNQMISLYEGLGAVNLPERQYTLDKFAQQLRVKLSQLYIKCDSLSYVEKIGVCYQNKNEVYRLVDCSKKWSRDCGSKKIILKNWKVAQRNIDVYDWKQAEKLDLSDFGELDTFLVIGAGLVVFLALAKMCQICLRSPQQHAKPKFKRETKNSWNSLGL